MASQSTSHCPLVTDYVWGLDLDGTLQGAGGVGGLLAVIRSDCAATNANPNLQLTTYNSQLYFPTYDANGNITEYVTTNGKIVAHYDYSPFGETLIESGDLASSFTHRFSTKPWCPVTGLYEYQMRKYRPEIGRWLSRDPIGEQGGLNLLLFCSNFPLSKVDIIGNDNSWPPPPWGGGNQNAPAIPPGMRYEYPKNHAWSSFDALMQFYFGNGGSFSLNETGHYDIVTKNINEAVKYWEF